MSKEIEEKLETEIDSASWDMLLDHHDRGAVFIISNKLELTKVGAALATDNTSLVSVWLGNKDLEKVSSDLALGFEKDLKSKIFNFLIVQPYVLIQKKVK